MKVSDDSGTDNADYYSDLLLDSDKFDDDVRDSTYTIATKNAYDNIDDNNFSVDLQDHHKNDSHKYNLKRRDASARRNGRGGGKTTASRTARSHTGGRGGIDDLLDELSDEDDAVVRRRRFGSGGRQLRSNKRRRARGLSSSFSSSRNTNRQIRQEMEDYDSAQRPIEKPPEPAAIVVTKKTQSFLPFESSVVAKKTQSFPLAESSVVTKKTPSFPPEVVCEDTGNANSTDDDNSESSSRRSPKSVVIPTANSNSNINKHMHGKAKGDTVVHGQYGEGIVRSVFEPGTQYKTGMAWVLFKEWGEKPTRIRIGKLFCEGKQCYFVMEYRMIQKKYGLERQLDTAISRKKNKLETSKIIKIYYDKYTSLLFNNNYYVFVANLNKACIHL